jgi:hypothetical protein
VGADGDCDRDFLSKLQDWHCPKLGELSFRGLMIYEDWEPDSLRVAFSLTVALFFLIIVGAKLAYGW